jgi:hypothetical protein
MGHAFMLLLGVFAGLGVLIGCAFLAVFIAGWRKQDRNLQLLGAIPLLLGIVWVLCLVNAMKPLPPDQRARSVMTLPEEALVTAAEGEGGSSGLSITFLLPPTRSPEEWLDVVWKLGALAPYKINDDEALQMGTKRQRYSRVVGQGFYSRSLQYIPATKTYSYYLRRDD